MSEPPIGHLVRAARLERGLTQTALAAELGVSVSYVNRVEHDRRMPKGARLAAFAAALDLAPAALTGEAERALLADLDAAASDPALGGSAPDRAGARALLGRHRDWAEALVALHRIVRSDRERLAAFADRLNHDPVLGEAMHEMLNAATAIRSLADILEDGVEGESRRAFQSMLSGETERLAAVSRSLAGFFDRAPVEGQLRSTGEAVDAFLLARRNHFPELEAAMEGLGSDLPALAGRFGIALERKTPGALPAGARRMVHFDRDAGLLRVARGLAPASERFELARAIASRAAGEAIEGALAGASELAGDEATDTARRALTAYAAACLVLPYAPFLEAAETMRYDIDALALRFGASPEQLCHRFTTLRRPGAEGVPFGFLRANAAGYLTKRFPLPRFPLPRYGGACPLWAVYAAMQNPEQRQRQVAQMPNGDRFFLVARATRPAATAFGHTLPSHALMLVCDALNADRLVYADGLDLSVAEPVGPTCLLCPRTDCAHRQEEAMEG